MDNQTNNQEVLEAISEFSTHLDEKFKKIDERFEKIENTMVTKDYVDQRFNKIESQMVTKDYLDDKLADLRGDLVVLTRKEDTKVVAIINLLTEKHLITEIEAKNIMAMEPFPQMSI